MFKKVEIQTWLVCSVVWPRCRPCTGANSDLGTSKTSDSGVSCSGTAITNLCGTCRILHSHGNSGKFIQSGPPPMPLLEVSLSEKHGRWIGRRSTRSPLWHELIELYNMGIVCAYHAAGRLVFEYTDCTCFFMKREVFGVQLGPPTPLFRYSFGLQLERLRRAAPVLHFNCIASPCPWPQNRVRIEWSRWAI